MGFNFKIVFALAGFLWFGVFAGAQPFTITAEVDHDKITLSESVKYTVKVSGTTQNLPAPELPDFPGFIVLQYLPTSTQIFQTMGTFEVSRVTGAVLKPTSVGKFTIPPASVMYQGKIYKSNSVTIEVVKESSDLIPPSLANLGIISASTDEPALNKWLTGKLFLLAEVSPTEPYIGQPVILSYYLYDDGVQIADPRFLLPEPQYKDFIKQAIKEPGGLEFTRKNVDGRLYDVALVQSIALIPTKTGDFSLDPLRMSCKVVIPSHLRSRQPSRPRSFFDDEFFDSFFNDPFFSSPFDRNSVSAVLVSQPVTIKVNPLPEPAPPDFSGTVGNYTLETSVDRTSAREDELITLKIKFTGTGYVDSIAEPKLASTPDFEVYSSKSKSKTTPVAGTLAGEKEFEFVLRPKRPGKLTVQLMDYVIFNPDKNQYERLTAEPIQLQIAAVKKEQPLLIAEAKKEARPGSVNPSGEQETVVTIGKDINYIHTGELKALRKAGYIFMSRAVLLLQLIPALAVAIAFIISQRQQRLAADRGLARKVYARGVASRRLRLAKKSLNNRNPDEFFAEVSKAMRGFIADKLNKPTASLTVDEAIEELQKRSVPEEICQQIKEILERCDVARYTSINPAPEEMNNLFQQCTHIINSLEKLLK